MPALINRSMSALAASGTETRFTRSLSCSYVGLAERRVAMLHFQHVIGHGRAADQHVEEPSTPRLGELGDHVAKPHRPQQLSDFIAVDRDPARRGSVLAPAPGRDDPNGSRLLPDPRMCQTRAPLRPQEVIPPSRERRRQPSARFDRWIHVLDLRPSQFATIHGHRSEAFGSSFRRPIDVEWSVHARCLGKQRRHTPRPGRQNGSRVERRVESLLAAGGGHRRQSPFDPRVYEIDQWP